MNNSADTTMRFLFEQADIRGETVLLNEVVRELTEIHQYPPAVNRLLGEFLAAAVLLAGTLKFEGKLILQARSEGQIPLLMVECTSERSVRGIARGAAQATASRFDQLLSAGQLAITIDPAKGQRYQGIVPLGSTSLAHSLEAYFQQSEQLRTRFWLASDGTRAAGMLAQQLPAQQTPDNDQRQQQWEHIGALAETVTAGELLKLAAEKLLYRLFHEEQVRLFDPLPVTFQCDCSRERTLAALAALGAEEVEDLLQELGSITMDCEFCNQRYSFQREDLSEPGENTLH